MENKRYKTLIRSLVLASLAICFALALVLTKPAHVVKAQSGCTVATLSGSYGYLLQAFFLPHERTPVASALVAAEIGVQTYDGTGNTSGSETVNGAGTIFHRTYTGTYSVNPDCTGSVTLNLDNGVTVTGSFTIVDGGKEIEVLNTTTSGPVEFGSQKKQ